MNKVVLMGRLTKEPEIRYSKSDNAMAITHYALAVKRKKGKESDKEVDFVNVVAFGKSGEFAEKYFQKGQMVTIVGRIHQDTWEDTKKIKHYLFEVIADEQYFAGHQPTPTKEEMSVKEQEISQEI